MESSSEPRDGFRLDPADCASANLYAASSRVTTSGHEWFRSLRDKFSLAGSLKVELRKSLDGFLGRTRQYQDRAARAAHVPTFTSTWSRTTTFDW
jgi:hypothetical protein